MVKIIPYPQHLTYKYSIMDHIRGQKIQHPGAALGVSMGDTWSGPKNLHTHKEVCHLVSWIKERLDLKNIEMWGNILGPGGQIGAHSHFSSISDRKSGVYYLTPGNIYLKNVAYLTMMAGTVLFFPDNQIHQVDSHPGPDDRITVVFNAW